MQIFEDKREITGSSNPHPQGQVWALGILPNDPTKEEKTQLAYYEEGCSVLLFDYQYAEIKQKARIVVEN